MYGKKGELTRKCDAEKVQECGRERESIKTVNLVEV